MDRELWSAGLALAVIVLGACVGPMETACTPGESRACWCADGASGAQVCDDDGARLGECACAVEPDGAVPSDAGADAGVLRDAGRDAGLDAGTVRDAGHDAGRPVDSGTPPECDLYSRAFCTPVGSLPDAGMCPWGHTCRRSADDDEPRDNVHTGPPECQPFGSIPEHNLGFVGLCLRDEQCDCGLFCRTAGECVRYCDPAGERCPDYEGLRQRCVEDALGVFYCSAA